jgi:protein-L-isoaspartate O-methyltransferase
VDYRAIAARELEAMGAFRSPWLRGAFHAVNRKNFAPTRFWSQRTDDQGRQLLHDRDSDPDAWEQAVWDTHRSLITQIDDGRAVPDAPTTGDFTSSISALDIVYEKLNWLNLEPGHSVLELGYASGYNTALLCDRAGAENVTAVEVDAELAAWGADNLKRAGYTPTLVCGDGLLGAAERAPFNVIISTASVRAVPDAWRAQAAAGGVIVTPFNTLYRRGALLKLSVRDETAQGQFVGSADYMWVRSHRPNDYISVDGEPQRSRSVIEPREVLERSWVQDFVIGLHVADVRIDHRGDGDERRTQLWDEAGTSVAIVRHADWWEDDAVTRWGPRNLWREVVDAYTQWREAGQPHYTRYGVTVDRGGHHLWLDTPRRRLTRMRTLDHPAEVGQQDS